MEYSCKDVNVATSGMATMLPLGRKLAEALKVPSRSASHWPLSQCYYGNRCSVGYRKALSLDESHQGRVEWNTYTLGSPQQKE